MTLIKSLNFVTIPMMARNWHPFCDPFFSHLLSLCTQLKYIQCNRFTLDESMSFFTPNLSGICIDMKWKWEFARNAPHPIFSAAKLKKQCPQLWEVMLKIELKCVYLINNLLCSVGDGIIIGVYSDASTPNVLSSILSLTSVEQIVVFTSKSYRISSEVKSAVENKLKSINLRNINSNIRIVCSDQWIEVFRAVFSTLKVSSSRVDNPYLTTQQNSLIGGVIPTSKNSTFPQWIF